MGVSVHVCLLVAAVHTIAKGADLPYVGQEATNLILNSARWIHLPGEGRGYFSA